jgi:hypothetical protein
MGSVTRSGEKREARYKARKRVMMGSMMDV